VQHTNFCSRIAIAKGIFVARRGIFATLVRLVSDNAAERGTAAAAASFRASNQLA
jgi:hypothetical protein